MIISIKVGCDRIDVLLLDKTSFTGVSSRSKAHTIDIQIIISPDSFIYPVFVISTIWNGILNVN